MESGTASAADAWSRIRLRHRLMVGFSFAACPFVVIDVLVIGRRMGISTAFFLMLAYICSFIVATALYAFSYCPNCGEPMRNRPGSGGGRLLTIQCPHCGAVPR